jgi:hypothetical protein
MVHALADLGYVLAQPCAELIAADFVVVATATCRLRLVLVLLAYDLSDWVAEQDFSRDPDGRLLLVTDQFEELFTFAETDASREAMSAKRHFVELHRRSISSTTAPQRSSRVH